MKSLTTSINPATGLFQAASLILDHAFKMDQIDKAYKSAKRKSKQDHQLQMQQLNNEMNYFMQMAQLESQQSYQSHQERMALTKTLQNLTIGFNQIRQPQAQQKLNELITLLIHELRDSKQTHVNFLKYTNTAMIGGK